MTLRFTALLVPLFLCGCVSETVGDFGRKEDGVFSDIVSTGRMHEGRGPASNFPMTDEENDLRNVAWDLLKPPSESARWTAVFDSKQWVRMAPQAWYGNPDNDFYVAMRNSGLTSHETYYELLTDQARSDASKFPLFRDVAMRVGKADAARRGALSALYADAAMREEAEARISENASVVQWVERSIQFRIRAYRTALGRLMIEMPSTKAVEAEAAIDALQWETKGFIGSSEVARYRSAPIKKSRSFRPASKKSKA